MNANQKVVLDWFKKVFNNTEDYPIDTMQLSGIDVIPMTSEVRYAYDSLTSMEEFEVLAEFAKWGLEDAQES